MASPSFLPRRLTTISLHLQIASPSRAFRRFIDTDAKDIPIPTGHPTLSRLPGHENRSNLIGGLAERLRVIEKATASSNPQAVDQFETAELHRMQIPFEWGDTYAPNDLSMEERVARRKNRRPTRDAFDVLGINPLNEYKNFSMLGEYVTSMGRIKHSSETGLRPVNQRKIAKAIRRAVGIGLLPSVHRHPEVLKRAQRNYRQRR